MQVCQSFALTLLSVSRAVLIRLKGGSQVLDTVIES